MDIAKLQTNLPGIARFLGLTFTSIEKDRVTAEIVVKPEHANPAGTVHGGAIMAMADTMGAFGTWANLREGQDTTTVESKTNFFAAAPVGTVLSAESVPLHRGRRTQVWETRLTRPDGKLVAKVTQTQLVME